MSGTPKAPTLGISNPAYWIGMIDEIEQPYTQFREIFLAGSTPTNLPTEDIELGRKFGSRVMAPLQVSPSDPTPVGRRERRVERMRIPYINLEQAVNVDELYFGTFLSAQGYEQDQYNEALHNAGIAESLIDDYQYLLSLVENREEKMVTDAMLHAQIDFNEDGFEAFTLQFPRDATATAVTTGGLNWDEVDPTSETSILNTSPLETAMEATRIMTTLDQYSPTHCFSNGTVSSALTTHPALNKSLDDRRRDTSSNMDLFSRLSAQGGRYLGFLHGIEYWEFNAQVESFTGGTETFLKDKTAYYVHLGPAAPRRMFYGAIPNAKIALGRDATSLGPEDLQRLRPIPLRRFADLTMNKNGTSVSSMLQTRPLPVNLRPNSTIEYKVLL